MILKYKIHTEDSYAYADNTKYLTLSTPKAEIQATNFSNALIVELRAKYGAKDHRTQIIFESVREIDEFIHLLTSTQLYEAHERRQLWETMICRKEEKK